MARLQVSAATPVGVKRQPDGRDAPAPWTDRI